MCGSHLMLFNKTRAIRTIKAVLTKMRMTVTKNLHIEYCNTHHVLSDVVISQGKTDA